MKKSLLIACLISLSSSLSWAKSMTCTSNQNPTQLYVEIYVDDEKSEDSVSKFSLKYNLADPLGPNTDTYIDTFEPELIDGSWILSDSYLRGIKLYQNPQWHAQVELFELETPIILNCH